MSSNLHGNHLLYHIKIVLISYQSKVSQISTKSIKSIQIFFFNLLSTSILKIRSNFEN